jgi:hypothetical protein
MLIYMSPCVMSHNDMMRVFAPEVNSAASDFEFGCAVFEGNSAS